MSIMSSVKYLLLLACLLFMPLDARAQCASNAAVTPITSTDESSNFPGARVLVNGAGSTVNLTNPNQVQIDVTSATLPFGVSNIPQKRVGTWSALTTAAAAFTATNITAPLSAGGTLANNAGTSGVLIKCTTGAASTDVSGVHSASYNETEYQMAPIYACRVQTGSAITSQRLWNGMAASALSGSTSPAVNCAAFRYDTTSDTKWTAYTSNGTGTTATATSVSVAANTTYDLAIDMSSASQVLFYINGSLVATQTATLPTTTTPLGPVSTVTTLSSTAAVMSVGQTRLESY